MQKTLLLAEPLAIPLEINVGDRTNHSLMRLSANLARYHTHDSMKSHRRWSPFILYVIASEPRYSPESSHSKMYRISRTLLLATCLILSVNAQFTVSNPVLNAIPGLLGTNGFLISNPVGGIYRVNAQRDATTSIISPPNTDVSATFPYLGTDIPAGIVTANAPTPSIIMQHQKPKRDNQALVAALEDPTSPLPEGSELIRTADPVGTRYPSGFAVRTENPTDDMPTTVYSPSLNTANVPSTSSMTLMKSNEDKTYTAVPTTFDEQQRRLVSDLGDRPDGNYFYTYKK
ncbi:hypothetical protein PROFUN_03350 [Planoprotostelium fungivorum]|uniref:Uncharacterized protein n=1 Tax=Planoprotostelium fungivorum TaxID=1890364 RepID=A0A2P6NWA6_9EUKA|nr:hypothetical protein PROFUN_03350 [Planoprotostelium fungivorum]